MTPIPRAYSGNPERGAVTGLSKSSSPWNRRSRDSRYTRRHTRSSSNTAWSSASEARYSASSPKGDTRRSHSKPVLDKVVFLDTQQLSKGLLQVCQDGSGGKRQIRGQGIGGRNRRSYVEASLV